MEERCARASFRPEPTVSSALLCLLRRLVRYRHGPIMLGPYVGSHALSSMTVGKKKAAGICFQRPSQFVAPQVGLEPTTLRLTAECSAIELLRNKRPHMVSRRDNVQGAKGFYSRRVRERQPPARRCKLALRNNLREYLRPYSP